MTDGAWWCSGHGEPPRVSRGGSDGARIANPRAVKALDAALMREDTGRLRYWCVVCMIDSRWDGTSGTGAVSAVASRIVNERARCELRRRGDAWRAAGLGPIATVEAVRTVGVSISARE